MEYFVWNMNPTILHLGPLQLRWYGLFFVGSFFLGLYILQWIFKREGKDVSVLDNLLIYILVGTVIGARLMHCFAYQPEYYLAHPLEILQVWKGGLASHGGLLGVLIALYLFTKRYHIPYLWLMSRLAIPGALAATFIRIGNFFNSEILGIPTDKPWAIIFERIDSLPRHPSQLYEALAYFILFFILLGLYRILNPKTSTKLLSGIFFTYVFTARFFLEYFKEHQADYNISTFSTGQLLSIPFIILGIIWILWALKGTSSPVKKTV